jgi:small basic protein (TIGR04137 family)
MPFLIKIQFQSPSLGFSQNNRHLYHFFGCHLGQTPVAFAPQDHFLQPPYAMSKHNSLRSSASVGGKRSVLKRFERVKLLKERGEWKDGRSPVGLPKTKHEG